MRRKNGYARRTAIRFGLVAALMGCVPVAHAAYAQLAPPVGASTGTGGQLMYKPAANEKWLQSTVRTNAALNVGGRTVQVPAALRMASNAPRFMARAAFSHPALLAGAIAAPYLIDWALSKGYTLGDDFDNPGTKRWEVDETNYGRFWMIEALGVTEWHVTPGAACGAAVARLRANTQDDAYGTHTFAEHVTYAGAEPQGCSVKRTTWAVQENRYYYTDYYGSFQTKPSAETGRRPATLTEFEDDLASTPMPQQVPQELPIPLPVDLPIINPSPAAQPVPQPLTIPLGDPVPVPNTDPQQYKQPVAHVAPSPTLQNPWRVDVREEEVTSTSPDGVPDPTPNEGSPETKPDDQKDFCESNPTSIACAEMDTPEGEIPRDQKEVTYQAEDVLGGGSCPADKTMFIAGQQLKVFDWQVTCGYIVSYVKPIILALSAFIAMVILIPGMRGEI